ncbi:hypothetical protein [Ornithinimicrobium cerasi]|uniref:hypothetical protein n=1 Tax=Ornithinimicrobium cerasi TaxID=2248773 RepID=UPI001F47D86A|nr:hypothetical protein [Ornithinimicrobium cerasi]
MGPAFEDVDWRQLDPRQYDPRRIVREALATPSEGAAAPAEGGVEKPRHPQGTGRTGAGAPTVPPHDPARPTPFDVDAT